MNSKKTNEKIKANTKKNKDAIKKMKISNFITTIVTLIIIFVVLFIFSLIYKTIANRIISNSLSNMNELSRHDEKNIRSSLEYRFREIEGLANVVRLLEYDNIEDVLEYLDIKVETLNGLDAVLVADDGTKLNSLFEVTEDKELLDYANSQEDRFLTTKNIEDPETGETKNVLLLGIRIEPFTVEDKNFVYAACYYDTNSLRDDLRIKSFNNTGYSSVIDFDGNYIVSEKQDTDIYERDNFFNIIEKADIHGDLTIDQIREKMKNNESFNIEYYFENEERLMTFTPMNGNIDWYFVMVVPRAVLEAQSNSFFQIILILTLGILFTMTILLLVVLRNKSQKKLINVEMKHRDELQEALMLAEQANIAKTTFLNNMSHDIRTPMNAIIGFTNLAITHIDSPERIKDYLEKINQSSNHLLSLINDVLDMSRIESGKVSIEEKEENMADILHGIRNIIQADIHAKQLEFFINTVNVVDEDIYCDKLRLNQVLLNLLSNALKFTPPGGTISLIITEKNVNKKGVATYEFRVKDTGIGIGKDFLNAIFEPFARERNSTVSGIQGTGLGMAITKNIVDMMNGKIEVQSEVGKGTEFIVTLNLRLQKESKKIVEVESLKGIRALVVDDDLDACKSVSHMLRQMGMKSEWTMYGKEAVARTEEAMQIGDKYEIYIIDWLMPDMNGIETTRRIRNLVGKDAPIIILSAYDWSEIEKEAKEAGVTDFVGKPLFLSDLERSLKRAYGKTKDEEIATDLVMQDDFKGKRILLVEDNMMNREISTEYLQDFGFLVENAENGKEACEMLKNSNPGFFDLVLMDIQMPIMNGYEATREIRKFENKELANIPILAMTANAFDEDKKAAKEAGMNGHLSKPIDIPELIKMLKEVLKNR